MTNLEGMNGICAVEAEIHLEGLCMVEDMALKSDGNMDVDPRFEACLVVFLTPMSDDSLGEDQVDRTLWNNVSMGLGDDGLSVEQVVEDMEVVYCWRMPASWRTTLWVDQQRERKHVR